MCVFGVGLGRDLLCFGSSRTGRVHSRVMSRLVRKRVVTRQLLNAHTYAYSGFFFSLSLMIRMKRKLIVCIVYALDGMMMMIRVCVCLIRSGPVQDISREREGHGCVREGCGGV